MPVSTKTRLTKAHAAQKAQAAQFAAQVIVIDPNWRIRRMDRWNWEIQYKGRFYGYYGRLLNALQALPAKMLDAEVLTSLATITDRQQAINSQIATALKFKLA
jgi:hypothetical protein